MPKKRFTDRIPNREHRWRLGRLACYCTVKDITEESAPQTFLLAEQVKELCDGFLLIRIVHGPTICRTIAENAISNCLNVIQIETRVK